MAACSPSRGEVVPQGDRSGLCQHETLLQEANSTNHVEEVKVGLLADQIVHPEDGGHTVALSDLRVQRSMGSHAQNPRRMIAKTDDSAKDRKLKALRRPVVIHAQWT